MPQLFAMIETYESTHSKDTSKPSLCDMLQQTSGHNNTYQNNNSYNQTIIVDSTCTPVSFFFNSESCRQKILFVLIFYFIQFFFLGDT